MDGDLYDTLEAFVVRHGAPEGLGAAISFHRRLDGRSWAGLAHVVREGGEALDPWLDPELHRDAGVTAFLAGDAAGEARALYDRLAPEVGRAASDLRSRLLEAYVRRGEDRTAAGAP